MDLWQQKKMKLDKKQYFGVTKVMQVSGIYMKKKLENKA